MSIRTSGIVGVASIHYCDHLHFRYEMSTSFMYPFCCVKEKSNCVGKNFCLKHRIFTILETCDDVFDRFVFNFSSRR